MKTNIIKEPIYRDVWVEQEIPQGFLAKLFKFKKKYKKTRTTRVRYKLYRNFDELVVIMKARFSKGRTSPYIFANDDLFQIQIGKSQITILAHAPKGDSAEELKERLTRCLFEGKKMIRMKRLDPSGNVISDYGIKWDVTDKKYHDEARRKNYELTKK